MKLRRSESEESKEWQSFKFALLEILVSRNPNAFFSIQIECPHV